MPVQKKIACPPQFSAWRFNVHPRCNQGPHAVAPRSHSLGSGSHVHIHPSCRAPLMRPPDSEQVHHPNDSGTCCNTCDCRADGRFNRRKKLRPLQPQLRATYFSNGMNDTISYYRLTLKMNFHPIHRVHSKLDSNLIRTLKPLTASPLRSEIKDF